MNQSKTEEQIKIWKDLAISKQMMMHEAANGLNLKPDWTQEDLKVALDTAIKRATEADENMSRTLSEAEESVKDMQLKLQTAESAQAEAEARATSANIAKQQAEQQLANGRKDNADVLKKAKQQLADKNRELKSINSALADTPENIVKKLKTLKKQKYDEARARIRAEDANRNLKKEQKILEEKLEEQQKKADQGVELASHYQDLREFCESQQEALKAAGIDVKDLPEIDVAILETLEPVVEAEAIEVSAAA